MLPMNFFDVISMPSVGIPGIALKRIFEPAGLKSTKLCWDLLIKYSPLTQPPGCQCLSLRRRGEKKGFQGL